MDYIIADRVALPPEYAPLFVEAVLSMPPSLLPNSHRSNYPSVTSVTVHTSRTLRGAGEREGEGEGEEDCEWGAGKVALLALYEHYKLDPQLFQRWLSLVSEHVHQGEHVLMTSETTFSTNESSSSPTSAVLVLQEGAYPLLTTPVLRRLAAKVCVCVCVCVLCCGASPRRCVCACMCICMRVWQACMYV